MRETLLGKMINLGDVFHPFAGLMGAPGVMAGGDGLPDVDEASGCSGWIVWQILGCYNLTNRVKPCYGKKLIWGVFSVLLGV